MIILAFDLATVTGVAVGDTRAKPLAITENLGEVGTAHGARFSHALRMTTNLIVEYKPDYIAIEAPITGGVKGDENRAKMLIGLRACVYGVAHMRRVKIVEYPVPTIRKYFIGHGSLPSVTAKDLTRKQCDRRGWANKNHNEADALAVWAIARAKLDRLHTPTPNGLFDHAGCAE